MKTKKTIKPAPTNASQQITTLAKYAWRNWNGKDTDTNTIKKAFSITLKNVGGVEETATRILFEAIAEEALKDKDCPTKAWRLAYIAASIARESYSNGYGDGLNENFNR